MIRSSTWTAKVLVLVHPSCKAKHYLLALSTKDAVAYSSSSDTQCTLHPGLCVPCCFAFETLLSFSHRPHKPRSSSIRCRTELKHSSVPRRSLSMCSIDGRGELWGSSSPRLHHRKRRFNVLSLPSFQHAAARIRYQASLSVPLHSMLPYGLIGQDALLRQTDCLLRGDH